MRFHLKNDVNAGTFAHHLLSLGNGEIRANLETGLIYLPLGFCQIVGSVHELSIAVFPDLCSNYIDNKWLCERAILAPKNTDVSEINRLLLDKLPDEITLYQSVDTVIDPTQALTYPTEFLNSITPSGFPPHNLYSKVGAPVILLRTFYSPLLCN